MSASVTGTTNTSSTQTDTGALANVPSKLASEETFLKLLVAQMKNQDPLNPMDSTQFVTQLAQYSSLEQLIGLKQDADTLVSSTTQTTTTTPATTAASGTKS